MCYVSYCQIRARLDSIAHFGSARSVRTSWALVWVVNVQCTNSEGGNSAPLEGVVTMECGGFVRM